MTVSAMAASVVCPGCGSPALSASSISSRHRCAQKSIKQHGSAPPCVVALVQLVTTVQMLCPGLGDTQQMKVHTTVPRVQEADSRGAICSGI